MLSENWGIGVDIGGTKIEVACVDQSGRIFSHQKYPTRVETGSRAIIQTLVEVIQEIRDAAATPPRAVGVGVAGQVTLREGEVIIAPNLKWSRVPLQADLHEALKIPVVVMNDVRAATWGEWKHGAGAGHQDLVCLFIGTGIGGGIVSGGKLLTGTSNCAGELGHMTVDLKGPECTCGNFGCLEALASGWAIAKRAQQEMRARPEEGEMLLKMVNGNCEAVKASDVVEASLKGDALSSEIIEHAVAALIAGSVGIINALNPARLILGGGLGGAVSRLAERVRGGVLIRVLDAAKESFDVVPSHLLNEAGVIGAASYALNEDIR